MLLLINIILLKRCRATEKRWNRCAVSKGLSVASVKRRPSSFKKIVAFEPIGPNDSKARGTKWCVVERSAYLVSFLVAESCAAAAAVIEVDAK